MQTLISDRKIKWVYAHCGELRVHRLVTSSARGLYSSYLGLG